MGMFLHKRYGYVLVTILIVILILYQSHNGPLEYNEEFITVLMAQGSDENDDDPGRSFVESELVNLTDFKYILKSQVCSKAEDLLGKSNFY